LKNIVVIFAGGTGQRMNHKSGIPKQFLTIGGIPVIIHTLKIFESHHKIDKILVVCLESYIPKLQAEISKYQISKIAEIIPGGVSGQESIFLGLQCAKKYSKNPRDIVLIHDGVRPLITHEEITQNLACVEQHGNAISASKTYETIALKGEAGEIQTIFDREECMVAKAPQSFILEEILRVHHRAKKEKRSFIDTASMANFYGIPLHFVECSVCNVKLTTAMDYYLIESIMKTRDVENIFGI